MTILKKLNSHSIDEILSPDIAILLLRIGAGCLIMTHGLPKLMRILEGNFGFGDPLGIGAVTSLFLVTFAEVICALFVLIGLWTRLALIPLIFNMIVIFFVAHAGDPFGDKEVALLYLFMYISLFVTGAGNYSLDRVFSKRSE